MAPEIIDIANNRAEIEAHPFACDTFSYGILAWQIVFGDRPYVSNRKFRHTPVEKIKQHVVNGLRPEIPQGKGWPKAFVEMLAKSWHATPGERPNFIVIQTQLLSMRCAFAWL
jgi:hypothetical protein